VTTASISYKPATTIKKSPSTLAREGDLDFQSSGSVYESKLIPLLAHSSVRPYIRLSPRRMDANSSLTASVTDVWAGADIAWKQKKLKARKMPENESESRRPVHVLLGGSYFT
jgi:hypothetical protein